MAAKNTRRVVETRSMFVRRCIASRTRGKGERRVRAAGSDQGRESEQGTVVRGEIVKAKRRRRKAIEREQGRKRNPDQKRNESEKEKAEGGGRRRRRRIATMLRAGREAARGD